MNFKRYLRYSEPFYFSGIYKIVKYEYFNCEKCKPYYHAYYLPIDNKNWGDYVGGRPAQHNKRLTLKQCKALCEEHAKTYTPTKAQLKQAEVAREAWLDV